jgi:hypothetical protein
VTYIPPRRKRIIFLIFAHAQVILNSMHRHQYRLHVTYIPPRGKYIDLADLCACAGDPELDASLLTAPAL